jgi:hypothetical protein
VSAKFSAPNPTLQVTGVAGATGSGTVTGPGINCTISGSTTSGDCQETYDLAVTVTLTATPSTGSSFSGWQGDCSGTNSTCSFVITSNRTVSARFALQPPSFALECAVKHLIGDACLTAVARTYLDDAGNRDGVYNLGDLLAYLDRSGLRLSPAQLSGVLHVR